MTSCTIEFSYLNDASVFMFRFFFLFRLKDENGAISSLTLDKETEIGKDGRGRDQCAHLEMREIWRSLSLQPVSTLPKNPTSISFSIFFFRYILRSQEPFERAEFTKERP